MEEEKKKRGVQSIEVGWQLIDALYDANSSLGLKELASKINMSPSRAYTYLVSFGRVGLVKQNQATGHYDLGPTALDLGLAALTRTDVIQTARVAMSECRDKLEATTFLSLFGNMGPAIVYWRQGSYPVTVQVQAGSVLPIIGSATGNVFLAFMEDDALKPHIEREHGNTNFEDLNINERISTIRQSVKKNGVSTIKGGLIMEVAGIAAPVFDHESRLRAVITAIGPRESFNVSLKHKNVKTLTEIASSVSTRLGFSG